MTTETLTRPAPAEPTTPIRPSEAIRLGCLIAPVQNQGWFFDGDNSACALGAMALGFGYDGPKDIDPWDLISPHLPDDDVEYPHPIWEGDIRPVESLIWRLNDCDGWSRERIADWLEGLGL